jgi:hypothetical protein
LPLNWLGDKTVVLLANSEGCFSAMQGNGSASPKDKNKSKPTIFIKAPKASCWPNYLIL